MEPGSDARRPTSLNADVQYGQGLDKPFVITTPGDTHALAEPVAPSNNERWGLVDDALLSVSTEYTPPTSAGPRTEHVFPQYPSPENDAGLENSTNVALFVCQQQVLRPYLKFLFVVGWVPAYESASTCLQKFVNILHPALLVIPFLLHYCIIYATCFWREQITRHFVLSTVAPPMANDTNTSFPIAPIFGQCTHSVVQQYIPDSFHIIAYGYSFYALRFAEVEHLPTLMERVFIQTARTEMGFRSQRKLIWKLRLLLYCAVCWIILSQVAQALHILDVYPYIRFSWMTPVCHTVHARIIWLTMMVVGFTIADTVYMAVTINYCVQCLLLVQYIKTITEKTLDRRITLDEAIKEITLLKSHIRVLNHRAGVAISLMLVNFGNLCVLGTKELIVSSREHHSRLIFAAVGMAVVLWWLSVLLPIAVSAHLCAKCRRLRMLGHMVRGRPFGFEDVSLEELDSFILYVSSLSISSKLFLIPVRAENIFIACVILVVVLMNAKWLEML